MANCSREKMPLAVLVESWKGIVVDKWKTFTFGEYSYFSFMISVGGHLIRWGWSHQILKFFCDFDVLFYQERELFKPRRDEICLNCIFPLLSSHSLILTLSQVFFLPPHRVAFDSVVHPLYHCLLWESKLHFTSELQELQSELEHFGGLFSKSYCITLSTFSI